MQDARCSIWALKRCGSFSTYECAVVFAPLGGKEQRFGIFNKNFAGKRWVDDGLLNAVDQIGVVRHVAPEFGVRPVASPEQLVRMAGGKRANNFSESAIAAFARQPIGRRQLDVAPPGVIGEPLQGRYMLPPCAGIERYEAHVIDNEADAEERQPRGKIVDLLRTDLQLQ